MQLDRLRDRTVDQLFEAMLQLRTVEECYRFFDDLCTVGEVHSLAQRLEVARMLREGLTYGHIKQATGASTATISRVKRCLHYGTDGYNMVLDRLGDAGSEIREKDPPLGETPGPGKSEPGGR